MVRTPMQYMSDVIGEENDKDERQSELVEYSRLMSNSLPEARKRHPGRTMRAFSPRLAKKVLGKRYDDLFEEMMRYGEKPGFPKMRSFNRSATPTPDDFHIALQEVLGKRVERGTLRKENVNNLYAELIDTPRAKQYFRTRYVTRITRANRDAGEEYVRTPKGREKYYRAIEENHEVYRVVNPDTKTVSIVQKFYKERKGVRLEEWREISTGRFGVNPHRLEKRYS